MSNMLKIIHSYKNSILKIQARNRCPKEHNSLERKVGELQFFVALNEMGLPGGWKCWFFTLNEELINYIGCKELINIKLRNLIISYKSHPFRIAAFIFCSKSSSDSVFVILKTTMLIQTFEFAMAGAFTYNTISFHYLGCWLYNIACSNTHCLEKLTNHQKANPKVLA